MKHDVSIIIVTYNSANQIRDCLDSLMAERHTVSQEILVLDNASKDQTAEIIKAEYPNVRLILPGINLGFAAGVNLAASHSEAEFLLLLNPDTVIRDHAVDTIVGFARENPRYGFYGGRTLKPDGSLEPSSCWGYPTIWSMAMFALGLSALAKRNPYLDPESLGNWQRDSVKEVGVITGCFLLVSNLAWKEVGGFDERYFMYGEDVDLSFRARKAGYRPVICPDATLVHEVGQSSAKPIDKMRLLYRGKATLVRSHWSTPRRQLGLFFVLLGVALRACIVWFKSCIRRESSDSGYISLWRERKDWIKGFPPRSTLAR